MVVAVLLCVACVVSGQSDQITSLPGLNPPATFKQYAGYINVNNATGRNLFYWFVESQRSPANDPVVLWLNGGPGCSSLGGFFEELGPFFPQEDGTLAVNPYSWNKVANVIFLESPSGVGFSYSTDRADYTVGDVRTANDSYNFLLKFFQRYPQFAKNPFWVTGESYGGHYVPNLAKRILDGNKQSAQQINFSGFMAGNAWTDPRFDNYGAAFYWFSHAIISEDTFIGLNTTCDYSKVGPLSSTSQDACDDFQDRATEEMGNIDIYDIYWDVCLKSSHPGAALMRHLARAGSRHSRIAKHALTYNPCIDDFLTAYLNKPEVKSAIHANPAIKWAGCSDIIDYSYQDLLQSMLPVYRELLAAKIKILVYSGDVDAIVPVTGTRFWLKELNLPVVSPWKPWIGSSKQVAGYATVYNGLTFATVRNAGHLVPGTQPERALDMFSRFLSNGAL
jgi:serine carboxypeptidase-like clade 2